MTATHPAAAARAARMASLKTERTRPWRRTSSTASQATTNPTSSCTRPSIIFASPPWPLALRHGIKPFFLPEECEVATAASNRRRALRAGSDWSWLWEGRLRRSAGLSGDGAGSRTGVMERRGWTGAEWGRGGAPFPGGSEGG